MALELRNGLWQPVPDLPVEARSAGDPAISLDQFIQFFQYGGLQYPFIPRQTLVGERQEAPDPTFEGYIQGIYRTSGPVFALMACRMLLFSEARFQWQRMNNGRPGDLFGSAELQVLDTPWPNGTTGDLLARMIQDADIAGNSLFTLRGRPQRLVRLRPDWTVIVVGVPGDVNASGWDLDAELLGYGYQPGGPGSGAEMEVLLPEEVAHFAPLPDPLFRFRGISWLTPVLREIMGDSAASSHKLKFFENGATSNMVVTLDADQTLESFDDWVAKFKASHDGVLNAYKTLFLAGAKAEVVGADFEQMDFKRVQGMGQTVMAAAAGVPPVIVGFSEGLEASTYSNYAQARRRMADGTLWPLWRNAAGSLASLIPKPAGGPCRLWIDHRDIPFLREDKADVAKIQQSQASAISTLVLAGYDPVSVVAAIQGDNLSLLKHTGLTSVQLLPPGIAPPPEGTAPPPSPNGLPKPAPVPAGT